MITIVAIELNGQMIARTSITTAGKHDKMTTRISIGAFEARGPITDRRRNEKACGSED
jgi:hypothetical protein